MKKIILTLVLLTSSLAYAIEIDWLLCVQRGVSDDACPEFSMQLYSHKECETLHGSSYSQCLSAALARRTNDYDAQMGRECGTLPSSKRTECVTRVNAKAKAATIADFEAWKRANGYDKSPFNQTPGKQSPPSSSAPSHESSGPVTKTREEGKPSSSSDGGKFWNLGWVVALAFLLWKMWGSAVKDDTPSKLLAARRLVIAALAIDAMVGLLVCINAFHTKGILKAVQSGTRIFSDSLLSSIATWDRVASFTINTAIAVGICVVMWISACYRYSEDVIGAEGFEQKGWKFWGWVIPIISLYKPYKVLSEIYRAGSSYVGRTGWMQTNASGGLLAWWIAYLIIHILMLQSGNWMRHLIGSPLLQTQTPESVLADIIRLYDLRGWFFVMSLIVCVMWLKLINAFTNRLTTRNVVDEEPLAEQTRPRNDQDRTPPRYPTQPSQQAAVPAAPIRDRAPSPPGPHKSGPTEFPDFRPRPAEADTLQASVYEAIAKELESGETDKGLWTRLFAESNGDEKMTKVAYIKQRAAKLMEAERMRSNQTRDANSSPGYPTSAVPAAATSRGDDEWQRTKQAADLADRYKISIADAKVMVTHCIEERGDWFILKDGRGYGTLKEAIAFAKRGNN